MCELVVNLKGGNMKLAKRVILLVLVATIIFSLPVMAMVSENYTNVASNVIEVQKYGNLTMDIEPKVLYDEGYKLGDMLEVTVGDNILEIPFCSSYSDVDTGSLLVRDDQKNNLVVIAINMGNFSTKYDVSVGDKVTISLLEKEGYLSQYLLHQLERTNVRDDYLMDSIFANYRSIKTTGIKPAVLYRSSSPINNVLNRAAYSDKLTKAVGIKTVVNLADSKEELDEYFIAEDFNSEYYKSLYDNGKVRYLNMGVDIGGSEFEEKLVEGLRFINENDAPYLIHCTEGKDRTGYVSALLEALMGGSLDEIVSDYMITYENYYNVEKNTEQYNAIADSNIIASLTTIVCGYEKGTDISETDLVNVTEKYLARIGMTVKEIEALKLKLSADSNYNAISVMGTVTELEKYGHTSTDILIKDFYELGFEIGDMVTVIFDNGFVVEAPFLDGYYVEKGDPLVRAYPGHTNVAVCINYGKLYDVGNIEVGDNMTIMLTGAKDYLLQYEIRKLERTNNREDYTSDAIFANFRNIELGNIEKNLLYRNSSPINNVLGRASYSDKLIKDANVKTIVNLADSKENIAKYVEADDFSSPYYKELYDNNKVITLNMGLNYDSDEFKANIIKGLIFMSENDAPYDFHCTEGKDRAGFFAAVVESLMGATKDEIVKDYMESYANYYGVEKGSDKYNIITGDIVGMLDVISNTDEYLLSGGMTAEQISVLKSNLSTPIKVVENVEKTIYIVKKGDCLWNIALSNLGEGERYMEIYKLNKNILKNPSLILIGQKLSIPSK